MRRNTERTTVLDYMARLTIELSRRPQVDTELTDGLANRMMAYSDGGLTTDELAAKVADLISTHLRLPKWEVLEHQSRMGTLPKIEP